MRLHGWRVVVSARVYILRMHGEAGWRVVVSARVYILRMHGEAGWRVVVSARVYWCEVSASLRVYW